MKNKNNENKYDVKNTEWLEFDIIMFDLSNELKVNFIILPHFFLIK